MPAKLESHQTRNLLIAAVVILVFAFALRSLQFGDPMINIDENFYLLVGDRMLHGALPYADIWDRKPVGLFLIYAGIRLLGGSGILEYQVVATLFAAGTAILITLIAARMATVAAATAAGLIYLLMLGVTGGTGGQSPVFYNLFVAGAALAMIASTTGPAQSSATIRRLGCVAMALMGVAMQVKYTALFEGVFFGIVLLWHSWKAAPRPGHLAADALLWLGLALAPTLAALGYYAWQHQAAIFIYSNFLSIGSRSGLSSAELFINLGQTWIALHLAVFCVILSVLLEPWRRFARGPATFRFVLAWLAAAVFGYLIFGTYFDHYAEPLLVPITAAAAPLFCYRRYRAGLLAAAAMLIVGTAAYAAQVRKINARHGGAAELAQMVAAIKPRLTNCLFVFNGDPILYYSTGSCIPTRYAFPTHLNLRREADGIGVDPIAELRRILAGKPSVIVDSIEEDNNDIAPEAQALVRAELRRDYHPVLSVPARYKRTVIYERNAGA